MFSRNLIYRMFPVLFIVVTLIFSLLTPSTIVHAATFTVTNLNDSDAGSLRQAIISANATPGADTINFSVSGTIPLGSTLPDSTDAAGLTIDGTGQSITISGSGLYRVLWVGAGTSVTLNNLTIANGSISGNFGGGIFNNGGTLTITNSTISGNSADLGAGGIYIGGGTTTIANSTFSGNSVSSGDGGGIRIGGGTTTITNSTISGNSASGGTGGGIYQNAGTLTLHNTIVANNTTGGNCNGTITNGGNNIDDGITCGWGSISGSMSSTNPLLGTLANNGGSTQTFALLTGSPAINTGNDSECTNPPVNGLDQRGITRSLGQCDIGSYELIYKLFLPLIMR